MASESVVVLAVANAQLVDSPGKTRKLLLLLNLEQKLFCL